MATSDTMPVGAQLFDRELGKKRLVTQAEWEGRIFDMKTGRFVIGTPEERAKLDAAGDKARATGAATYVGLGVVGFLLFGVAGAIALPVAFTGLALAMGNR